jgi:hypothetical protein
MTTAQTTPAIRLIERNRNWTFAIDAVTALGLVALMFVAATELVYCLSDQEPATMASTSLPSGPFKVPEAAPILAPPP